MLTDIKGLKLETAEAKAPLKKHPIVFIHGSGGGAWTWENYLGFFSSRGYDCYALNLRGHHGSRPESNIGRISIHDHITDVSAVFRALNNPVLIGHSLGGLIVQKLAERFDPPAVVALCPAPPRGIFAMKSLGPFLAVIRHSPEILLGRSVIVSEDEANRLILNQIPPAEKKALYYKGLPQSGRLLLELTVGSLAVDASKVHCPMLIIAGSEDKMTPPETVQKIALKYQADFREYTGFAHMLNLEPGWEQIAEETLQWLERKTSFK
jgi:pimeloyl-ACP methyl ester carboxylesterase